jgi:hypothetical protein
MQDHTFDPTGTEPGCHLPQQGAEGIHPLVELETLENTNSPSNPEPAL